MSVPVTGFAEAYYVIDTPDPSAEPPRWRYDQNLMLFGSGAPSRDHLASLADRSVIVIDLREESHLFCDSVVISLTGPGNKENQGKQRNEIEEDIGKLKMTLQAASTALVYERVKSDGNSRLVQHEIAFGEVLTEAELCTELGLEYRYLPITDHEPPSEEILDAFVRLYKERGSSPLYLHCRGGSGRTTFLMVLAHILENKGGQTLEEIVAEQVALGGKDLLLLPDETSHKYKAAVRRKECLLELFARYGGENE